MFYFKLLLFFSVSFSVMAEHENDANSNQIYTKKSSEKINALNKTTEILRDPTQLSPNFRQALRGITPKGRSASNTKTKKALALPEIELAGKVLAQSKKPKAMLRINKKIYYVSENSALSFVKNNQVITVKVLKVNKDHVKITVSPHNQTLILQ